MATKKSKKEKRGILDKIESILSKINGIKKPSKVIAAGVVAAVIGGILKATALTQTFPEPWDTIGNVVLFIALVAIVIDFIHGGFSD